MDTIIGLGRGGCAIADAFAKYSQYKAYKLDVGLVEGQYTFPLLRAVKYEDYERKHVYNMQTPQYNVLFRVARFGNMYLIMWIHFKKYVYA